MKRKILVLLSCLFCAGALCSAPLLIASSHSVPVMAEEAAPSVVIESSEHGKVSIRDAKESYVAGEIVTLDIAPSHFYMLSSVSVNGVSVVADENGEYKFALASGENKISASFVVDEKLLGEFADIYVAAQNKDWKSLFSPQTLFILINFIVNSGIGFTLVSVFVKYKKSGSTDREEIISTIKEVVPAESKAIIADITQNLLAPIGKEIDEMNEALKKFLQAFLYSLDGTMESKEKIISLISGLDLSEKNSIDEMKQWFKNESTRIEEKTNEYKRIIAEMKEANAKALSETKPIALEKTEKDEITEEKEQTYDGTSI